MFRTTKSYGVVWHTLNKVPEPQFFHDNAEETYITILKEIMDPYKDKSMHHNDVSGSSRMGQDCNFLMTLLDLFYSDI